MTKPRSSSTQDASKPFTNAHNDLIQERRELVASLRLQGFTERRIIATLTAAGKVNPDTGAAWNVATIHGDLVELRKEWRKRAAEKIEVVFADELQKLAEVERILFSEKRYDLVLKCMEQRAKMLGMNKPVAIDVTSGGQPVKGYVSISPEDWDRKPQEAT